jgi:hypothetical protein
MIIKKTLWKFPEESFQSAQKVLLRDVATLKNVRAARFIPFFDFIADFLIFRTIEVCCQLLT